MANTTARIGTMASIVEYVSADACDSTRLSRKKRTARMVRLVMLTKRYDKGDTSPWLMCQMSVLKNLTIRCINVVSTPNIYGLFYFLIFHIKKQCPCKPGSVPLAGCLSFIYSASYPAALAFYPPSRYARTDSPQAMVYANLQSPEGTARRSPAGWWSLTPPSHPCSPQNPLAGP